MYQNKLFISLLIFITLLILTSIVKTKTRIIEKNISVLEEKIAIINNDLHETQLDYSYLASPENISKMINNFSNNEYLPIKYSNIYMSLDEYLKQQKKISKQYRNEKKIKKN